MATRGWNIARVATWIGMLAFAASANAAETVLPIEGEVPAGGPDHFFVEFEVPAGTVEIEVRHDDLSTANILDWGLEDPDGFRGWGGGNAEPAIVGLDAASRSYVPGPITPGTWRVVVGKAKIEEPPGQYALEIVLRDEPTLASQPERTPYVAAAALSTEARWYAGDFHVHSSESGDASAPLDDILAYARERGLDFVEITDHNVHTATDFFVDVQSRHPEALLLPGVELTTYAGHANAIGAVDWVDHKIGQPGITIEGVAAAYRDAGALFSLNHPTLDLGPLCIGCAWDHPLDAAWIDAVEIANGGLMPIGAQFTPGAISLWDELCAEGAHVAAIGGSDDHDAGIDPGPFQSPIGDPTTLVFAEELSVAAILEGVRRGRTVVKLQGPGDPMVELWPVEPLEGDPGDTIVADVTTLVATVTGGRGHTIRLVQDGAPGAAIAIDDDPFETTWDIEAPGSGQSRVRAEVLVDGQLRTITSHLWLERDEGGASESGGAGSGGVDDGTGAGGGSTGPVAGTSSGAGTTGDGPAGDAADAAGCGCRRAEVPGAPLGLLLPVLVTALGPRRRATSRPAAGAHVRGHSSRSMSTAR